MNNRIETAITAACLVVINLGEAISIADHEHIYYLEDLEAEAVELGRKIRALQDRIIRENQQ